MQDAIPLYKMPDVWPIGMGDFVKRIIGKAILRTVKEDIQRVVGPLQMCAGYESDVEVASLAMQALFKQDSTEIVLLVDTENTFNLANTRVALVNILRSSASIAPDLIDTCCSQLKLFIQGRTLISEKRAQPKATYWLWPCMPWPLPL